MEKQRHHIDLINGKLLPSLTGLALPIMATSMVQTAYNLTDMAWNGRVGSNAVAAIGAAGMYIWLSTGLVILARMGGQIKVAQSFGEGKTEKAVQYAKGALQMTILLAAVFSLVVMLFTRPMIAYYNFESEKIIQDSIIYLRITGGLIIFSFLNQTMTGLFTAIGDSRTPFYANCIGIAVNMILDPVLIFGIGPFPRMEAIGAAIATVIAQLIVTIVLLCRASGDTVLFRKIHILSPTKAEYFRTITKLGLPSSLQNMLFCGISMILTRLVASFGDYAIAIQRVGGQVECISWMAAEGFGSAMNAFTGQNYGAKSYHRVKKGYYSALAVMVVWGTLTSLFMITCAGPLFRIFIQEQEILPMGITFLMILGVGQMPMCVELMTVGALQGMSKTFSCSALTIFFTAIRIPLAYLLSRTSLGLNGIWWALSITSIAKGICYTVYYTYILRKLPKVKKQ